MAVLPFSWEVSSRLSRQALLGVPGLATPNTIHRNTVSVFSGQMAENGKIVLHAMALSSCSWRVRLCLDYKGIPYEYKAWDLIAGEHLSEEFKKISPGQTVPALEIDGAVLYDSIAILEYLEERFPEKPLLPKDLVKRAAIRAFVNLIASGIQPLQNLRVQKPIAAMGGEKARVEWAQKFITSGFDALEIIVKDTAGHFCFGDEFTFADVVLIPQLRNATHRFDIDLVRFPTLQELEENLNQLELVQNSTPEFMPDFQFVDILVLFGIAEEPIGGGHIV